MTTTPIHILWNKNAGAAAANQDVLLELQNRTDVTVHQPESGEETCKIAEQASDAGAEIVVAAGGDGGVNAVLQGLLAAGAKSKLAVVPLGTGNDFSRTLAVPLNIRQAVELIDVGKSRCVDVVRLETSSKAVHYINMATGGNTGRFMEKLTDDMKRFWGPMVYLRGVVDVLAELIPFDVAAQFDDKPPERFSALNVFVANGRTSGTGMQVAPDASIEDGLLDLVIVLDCEAVQLAGLAVDYAVGDYRENENIICRRARSVRIDATPAMAFSADGDPLPEGNARFAACPSKLEVIVGPDYVA